MKLFAYCKYCNSKIYINHPAKTRSELPSVFQLTCSNCRNTYDYHPVEIFAETGLTTAGGALLGGLLGLALGGPGALAGAILGGVIGRSSEQSDSNNVERFNNS